MTAPLLRAAAVACILLVLTACPPANSCYLPQARFDSVLVYQEFGPLVVAGAGEGLPEVVIATLRIDNHTTVDGSFTLDRVGPDTFSASDYSAGWPIGSVPAPDPDHCSQRYDAEIDLWLDLPDTWHPGLQAQFPPAHLTRLAEDWPSGEGRPQVCFGAGWCVEIWL